MLKAMKLEKIGSNHSIKQNDFFDLRGLYELSLEIESKPDM